MHTLTLNKNKKKPALTLQAMFNRYCHKINQLRNELEMVKEECEKALVFYHSKLKPKEKIAADIITQFILTLKELTKEPKALHKRERKILKGIIEDSLHLLSSFLPPNEIPDEIKAIYKQIYGKGYDDRFYEEISSLKNMFEEHGINDIDISNLNPNDTKEELVFKFFESNHEKIAGDHNSFKTAPKPKSKKELLKEQKAKELKALQAKNLGNIYKRLVKELHPDLEQDLNRRKEKENLMKRLTVAYENCDLITLLTLESEWLGNVDRITDTLNEESLKIYNSVLKDQIEMLKQEFPLIMLDPRYIDIHHFINEGSKEPLKDIQVAFEDCDSIIDEYRNRLKDLSCKNPLKFLKKVINQTAEMSEQDDLMAEFVEFFETLKFTACPK